MFSLTKSAGNICVQKSLHKRCEHFWSDCILWGSVSYVQKKYPHLFSPGAAIEEGTLKPGDRLLEVNSVCVDGMTQSDVVALLRNAPLGSEVKLVVSRHLTTTGNTGAALATTVQASGSSNSPHKDETSQQLVNASPSKKQIQFQFDDESTSHPAAAANAIPPEVNSLENDKEVSALAHPSLGSLRCSILYLTMKKRSPTKESLTVKTYTPF